MTVKEQIFTNLILVLALTLSVFSFFAAAIWGRALVDVAFEVSNNQMAAVFPATVLMLVIFFKAKSVPVSVAGCCIIPAVLGLIAGGEMLKIHPDYILESGFVAATSMAGLTVLSLVYKKLMCSLTLVLLSLGVLALAAALLGECLYGFRFTALSAAPLFVWQYVLCLSWVVAVRPRPQKSRDYSL